MATTRWARTGLLFLFVAALYARAAVYETVNELSSLEYDFIVVGGGTAGNVIANRLTEDPSITVLVLEAGGSNENVLNAIVPLYCPRLSPRTPWDWNSTTVPQIHANNRTIGYPRGFMLGGSSSINWMVYTRGSADDWNRYAQLLNDEGWAWDRMQHYFRKNEKFIMPTDDRDITGDFDPSVHSFEGMNDVSLSYPLPIASRVIETTRQLPDEFRFNEDYNKGIQYGVGWTQFTIGNGKRSSSATSYLGPRYRNRRNLSVLLHAHVTTVMQTGTVQGKPVIRGVEFKDGLTGQLFHVTAKKEVILSAGAFGTPHILLNSGIGDSSELSALGIKPVLDLPSVGRNLSDHALIRNFWPVNSSTTFEHFARNATHQDEALNEWTEHRTGLLTAGVASQLGWIRVPDNSKIFSAHPDLAAGPNTAHFELLFTNGHPEYPLRPESANLSTIGIYTAVLNPASRGTVTINSTDPFAAPLIDPNYLSAEPDLSIMREAIRSARRFAAAPAWKDYIIGSPTNQPETDDELNEYIRENVVSVLHASGTAAMSPEGATWGVVDPHLKVKGAVGLRVVDASVLPLIPSGHTQAPTYVIAERASDLIKDSWLNPFFVQYS